MSYSETIATVKAGLLQELRRKRRWQSYVVAAGLFLCFFMVVGSVFAESSNEPIEKESISVEKPSKEKIEGFQLSEQENLKTSNWETSTGAVSGPPTASVVVEETTAQEPEQPEMGPPMPVESEASDPLGSASLVAGSFYDALNQGHLVEAYSSLSPEFQDTLPFETFSNGYANLESIRYEITNAEELNQEQVRLNLQIDATEAGYPSRYYATCIVSKLGEVWTISGVAQLTLD